MEFFEDFRARSFFGTRRMSSRRRPLHTCGVSFLAIARIAYSRAQDFDGPLGSVRRMVRMAKLLSPLVFVLQNQWLRALSFADDRLLAIENIVEKIFPPSQVVFDKIDENLHLIGTFPGKFEDAVNKFPSLKEVQFLDLAVVHAISLLNSLITILMNWGIKDGAREKEISIDINCNEKHNGYESAGKSAVECCLEGTVSSVCEAQQAGSATWSMVEKMKSNSMKGTYKEVLEMGRTKAVEDDYNCKENEKETYKDVLVKGTAEAVEDCKNNERDNRREVKGIKVEDTEGCKKFGEANQSQKAEMECGENTEEKEETANGKEERVKECSEAKDEKESKGEEEVANKNKEERKAEEKDENENKAKEEIADRNTKERKECSEGIHEKENKAKEEVADENKVKKKECSEGKGEKEENKAKEEVGDKNKEERKECSEEENKAKEEIADKNKEGKKECSEEKEVDGVMDSKHEEANNESMESGDEILDLFESAWLMAPRKKEKGSFLSFLQK